MGNQKGYVHIIAIAILVAIIFSLLFLFPKTKSAIKATETNIVRDIPAIKSKIGNFDNQISDKVKKITGKVNSYAK